MHSAEKYIDGEKVNMLSINPSKLYGNSNKSTTRSWLMREKTFSREKMLLLPSQEKEDKGFASKAPIGVSTDFVNVFSPWLIRLLMILCPSTVSRYSFSWMRSLKYWTESGSHIVCWKYFYLLLLVTQSPDTRHIHIGTSHTQHINTRHVSHSAMNRLSS